MGVSEAENSAIVKVRHSPFQMIVYSLFFLFLIAAQNLISFSHYPQFKNEMLSEYEPLAFFTGLGQNWNLFSTPRKNNFHTSCVVTFTDGSLRLYEFPRVEYFDCFEKFRRYKLRQLFYHYLPNPIGEKYRPSMARFLVEAFADSVNPPERMSFDFNYCFISEPGEHGDTMDPHGIKKNHINRSTIFVYETD